MKVNMRMSSSRSSNIKATASSQSAGSKRAAEVKGKRVNIETEKVVVADERVFPSSHSQARADSNPTQFSYNYDDGSAAASAAVVALPELRFHFHAPQCQDSVFQYCSSNVKYDVQSHNQDSISLSSSVQLVGDNDEATKKTATTTTQTQVASTQQKAEANTTHRSSDVNDSHQIQIQPFNDDELMYLAEIFDKDSPSQDDELRSILSLDQECTIEDFTLAE